MVCWLMAVDRGGRYDGSCGFIQWSTRNHGNEGKTNNLMWMLYSVYAILQCMLYSVYAVLRVSSWWLAWRDRERCHNCLFCDDGRVVDENERDGGWRWEPSGGSERIWDIKGTICQIGLGSPSIDVMAWGIRTRTCRIGAGKLTRTRNSPSPSFSWWSDPSLLISLLLVLNSTVT